MNTLDSVLFVVISQFPFSLLFVFASSNSDLRICTYLMPKKVLATLLSDITSCHVWTVSYTSFLQPRY